MDSGGWIAAGSDRTTPLTESVNDAQIEESGSAAHEQ
jgi:hypothetical protein